MGQTFNIMLKFKINANAVLHEIILTLNSFLVVLIL